MKIINEQMTAFCSKSISGYHNAEVTKIVLLVAKVFDRSLLSHYYGPQCM